MLANFKHKHKLKKSDFKARLPGLRAQLLEVQNTLRTANFPVIVVFAGVDGAGKSEVVNLLNEWMDPRFLLNCAYTEPTIEESDRPEFWRYWRDSPPKGQIGLFLSAWYSRPLLARVKKHMLDDDFERCTERICKFEKMLATDGALILKFWMHLGRKQQKKRLRALESNPSTSWRVTDTDWANWAMYDRFVEAGEAVLQATDTEHAPWRTIDGANKYYRSIAVAEQILEAIQQHMETPRPVSGSVNFEPSPVQYLAQADMDQHLGKESYRENLVQAQGELNLLSRQARERGISSLLVFEGWDAAGKGGTIRRILHALDPKYYRVIRIAAPGEEESAHHYLWRFWRHLPRAGRVSIFDRSWYGRVLVERLEGFAEADEWQRAYDEINEFEKELTESGIVVCKFWLHITPQEQLRRFQERENTPHKAWKLTDEDWRNREKWDDYEVAVDDMIHATSNQLAPWTIVPANDKYSARIQVLKTFCDQLRKGLE